MRVAEANSEWAAGFLDECWWSRLALPTLNSWCEEGKPLRLIQQSVAKEDPEPKAICCYGLYLPELGDTWLRFVDGRPVSSITTQSPVGTYPGRSGDGWEGTTEKLSRAGAE
jgi:hypothetical protein